MKRLLAGVVLVALAGVAIWFATRGGDDPAPARAADPAPQPVERPQTVKVTPALPDQPRLAGDDAGVSQYTIDGIPVRDHRTGAGGQQPFDQRNVHEPNLRQIPATLTADVSRKVNAVMRECGRLLPPEARGPKPRLEGDLIVSIKSGVLTVDKSTMQLRDVVGDPGPMQQCVDQKTVGLSTAASDQADLTNYSIHVSFVVLAAPPTPGP